MKRALEVYRRLSETYGRVETFLDHESPFQLLVAVILSAQCTDARVNMVTPALFRQFSTPEAMAVASVDVIRDLIKSINFCHAKAKNLQVMSQQLLMRFQGQVPAHLDDLVTLAGVGRKTANVILGQVFGKPGITVDTHVNRLSRRLGFTTFSDAVRIERELMSIWPEVIWSDLSTLLIVHGRQVCFARKPQCCECVLADLCPSALV